MNRKNDGARGGGFTLVELLVVVAILGILMVAVVLAINPVEMMKKGRDATRLSDMDTLRKALDLSVADGATLTLTTVPGDSSAVGATQAADGTGWLRFDISDYLPALPLDPRNGATFNDAGGISRVGRYLYFSNGSAYELNCYLEAGDNAGKYGTDGGNEGGVYEVGTDLTLLPVT